MATMRPLTLQDYSDNLRKYVTQYRSGLLDLFPDGFSNTYGARAKAMVETLVSYHCPFEMALQFSVLVLFDLVILLDDSTSMDYGDDGRRRMTLLTVLEAIADIYVLARKDGIVSVHFLNTRMPWRNVHPKAVKDLHSRIQYNGVTMIGTQLQEKVLRRYVQQPKRMEKPLLTMVITDGEVEGERRGLIKKNIANCIDGLRRDANKTEDAVAFYFARIGRDLGARELIRELDNDGELGRWIDCLPVDVRLEDIGSRGPAHWDVIRKLMLGALYPYVDAMDDERPYSETEYTEKFTPDLAQTSAEEDDD